MKASFLFFLLLLSISCFAQTTETATSEKADTEVVVKDDTTLVIDIPDDIPGKDEGQGIFAYGLTLLAWLWDNLPEIFGLFSAFLFALEVVLSIVPTKWDLSFLTRIRRWLDNARFVSAVTKNRKLKGGVFKVQSVVENDESTAS